MRTTLVLVLAFGMTASASLAEEHRISMKGTTYRPAVVEAKVGDTLVFVNDDGEAHNVFMPTVGFSTDLGKQEPRSETRLALRKSGTFDIECVFHENMQARVVVRP
jgi:plastocyanin